MRKSSVELSVGIFVLIGILCVGYLAVRLGKMEIIGYDYYIVWARFSNVGGLKNGGAVEMAGVQIGRVTDITLDPNDKVAVVSMKINDRIQLNDDVIASVKTAGLIGDKFIKLTPGGSGEYLKDGDRIIETESPFDLEDLVSKYVFGDVK
jgi:phospholipid/cholesterol/gamma-HCH transport system substrate-binding protein